MGSWADFQAAAPELAEAVRGRFEAVGLAFLATLRADGSPRITGIETNFRGDDLLLGMMDPSLKALDLRRDPRLAMHAASTDKAVQEGDAKIASRAVEILDDAEKAAFGGAVEEATGQDPGTFALFRVEVSEASFLKPAGDHLEIDIWTEAGGLRRVDRY